MNAPDYSRKGFTKYGADMGRGSDLTPEDARALGPSVTLRKVSLDEGGYDPGGAYWGTPNDLWLATGPSGQTLYFRSTDPRDILPDATLDRAPNAADAEAFADAYVECAEWVEEERLTEENGGTTPDDWDPASLATMRADARAFYMTHAHMIPDANQGGHDLYLTRNGHGCGFWDREHHTQEERDVLSEAARKLGGVFIYVGDDGLIYLHD